MIIRSILFIFIARIFLIVLLTATTIKFNYQTQAASLPYMAPEYDDSDYMSYDELARNGGSNINSNNNNNKNHNTNFRRDTSAASNNNNNNVNANANVNNNNANNNNANANSLTSSNAANLKETPKGYKNEMLKPRRQSAPKPANSNNHLLKNSAAKLQRSGRSSFSNGIANIGSGIGETPNNGLSRLQTRGCGDEKLTCLLQAMQENTLALMKNLGDLETALLGDCKKKEECNKKKMCRLKQQMQKKKCDSDDDDCSDVCRVNGMDGAGGDDAHNFGRYIKRREPAAHYYPSDNERSKNFIAETEGAIQAWETQLSDTRKLLNDFATHKSKKSVNTPSWDTTSNVANNNYKSISSNSNLNSNLNAAAGGGGGGGAAYPFSRR